MRSAPRSPVGELPIKIRAARRDELEELGARGYRAFRLGDEAHWVRYYREHGHLRPADTLVAELGGVPAGQASMLRLDLSLAGVDAPMRGIAAVAVEPELRRRGIAARLVAECLRRTRRQGVGLSMLYPFRDSFYRRFGFEYVEWAEWLRLRPQDLPAAPSLEGVRRLDPERDLDAVRRVYDAWRARGTGPLRRSDYWWRVRVLERITDGVVVSGPDGGVDGYLLYEVPIPALSVGRQRVLIRELVAANPAARRALLGYLASWGEQVATVEMAAPRGRGVLVARQDPPGELPPEFHWYRVAAAAVGAGVMARIVDLDVALRQHPGPARSGARGTLGLELTDPVLAPLNGSFDIRLGARGARAIPGRGARWRLRLSIGRLSQIYFGAVPARDLLDEGLIDGSPRAAELLDQAFAGPPPFLSLLNGF